MEKLGSAAPFIHPEMSETGHGPGDRLLADVATISLKKVTTVEGTYGGL